VHCIEAPTTFDGVTTAVARCIQPPAAGRSSTLLPGRETLLEGPILGLLGLIEEKPAKQAGARPSGGSEPGIPADRGGVRRTWCERDQRRSDCPFFQFSWLPSSQMVAIQNEPNSEPSTITSASAMIGPTMPAMTMSK
jgi:hypothetical protein